ncbi:MAG: AEC family transporter [Clostridia bacterium]|nr:AEC family transporter [Clostridia bacterium]
MNSFLFAISAVAPIMIMVAIGYLLKKIKLANADIAKALNRLVFRVFLPCMLFLNVYKMDSIGEIDLGYVAYALIVLLVIFALGIPCVMLVTKQGARRGVLLQAVFRSNYALIGIPLAQSLFGEEGLAIATLLSAAAIPAFNILAVISLSVFDDEQKVNVKKILLGIVKNPLILSVLAGVAALGVRALFIRAGISFRLADIKPVYTVLGYLSGLATPLALLVLGVQFEFSAVKEMKKEIVFGTLARTVLAPALAIGVAFLFLKEQFNGAHFAAFVAMFATPVAVSSVPMAQEMKGDASLAGQLVVWTTLASALSVFFASWLLKLAGVF